jgi:hypothetical protein
MKLLVVQVVISKNKNIGLTGAPTHSFRAILESVQQKSKRLLCKWVRSFPDGVAINGEF